MGAFLMTLAGPLARQVLLSLGIGILSFVGLDTAVSSALGAAKSSISGMPADVLAMMAKFGIFKALSIMAGGVTAGVSMVVMKRFAAL